MFISKKKFKNLEKKIADLEEQVQSQQTKITLSVNTVNRNTYDLVNKHHQRLKKFGLTS